MSTGQRSVGVLFGREGNRRSGIALATRHILCGISTYALSGLGETGSPPGVLHLLPFSTLNPFHDSHSLHYA